MKTTTKNEVLTEGQRYISNAKEILKTKGKLENSFYTDKKYVKMAGHTAYTGILYALDHANILPPLAKKTQRRDVKDYQEALGKINKKMLGYYVSCYQLLHLVAGYDGVGKKDVLTIAINDATELITWASNRAS